jgi:GT2 family glycosyltransferase
VISVLTLVKNREAHLRNLVEGLRRSTVAPHELVIVDMSDRPVVQPVAEFPVRLVRLATDGLPLAKARNLAAAHASSPSLLFLDVDCIPGSALISRMADAMQQLDALICAEILYLTEADTANPDWTDASLRRAGVPHPARRFPPSGLAPEHNFGLFWSLAFGVSSRTFASIGGFDETFTGYGAEDTDFAFRARDGVFDPPLQHFQDICRNARRFYEKWQEWPMTGWLDAFERLGLLSRKDDRLSVIRLPTERDIRDARRPDWQPY